MKLQEYKIQNKPKTTSEYLPSEYLPLLEHRFVIKNKYIESWQVFDCSFHMIPKYSVFCEKPLVEGNLNLTCCLTEDFDIENLIDTHSLGEIELTLLNAGGFSIKKFSFKDCVINKYSTSLSYNKDNIVKVLFEIKFSSVLITNCLDEVKNVK